MRILVTGNAGSGKTTLAKRIGDGLDLPVHGLDTIVWQPGWKKTPPAERDALEAKLIAHPTWVIDGVSDSVLASADIVIFLDVARRTSFLRCARRNWRYLFRSRPGLPEGCPEILVIGKLTRVIWRFPSRVRPKILANIETRTSDAYIVRSPADLTAALAHLGL